jgi:hypothetical protein
LSGGGQPVGEQHRLVAGQHHPGEQAVTGQRGQLGQGLRVTHRLRDDSNDRASLANTLPARQPVPRSCTCGPRNNRYVGYTGVYKCKIAGD